eukprot:5688162-Pyramimonas_sp.AAC.1
MQRVPALPIDTIAAPQQSNSTKTRANQGRGLRSDEATVPTATPEDYKRQARIRCDVAAPPTTALPHRQQPPSQQSRPR